MALPLWERHWLHGFIARIGVLDTTTAELTVLAPRFWVLHLQQFDGRLLSGLDSPVDQPKALGIDVASTPKKSIISLKP